MKAQFKAVYRTMVYFFTPEDSTATAGQGNLSIDIKPGDLNMGSLKALFWVLGTMGMFYLVTLL
ncbi:MAG: hypothetical protein HUK40_04565 [Desulfobacter sp.]|nr:hypothetical protein [Desulfobacter sp.]WDP87590.1 MAG: hypothetical protein HUN05_22720 [Desulfobacter sp.]